MLGMIIQGQSIIVGELEVGAEFITLENPIINVLVPYKDKKGLQIVPQIPIDITFTKEKKIKISKNAVYYPEEEMSADFVKEYVKNKAELYSGIVLAGSGSPEKSKNILHG